MGNNNGEFWADVGGRFIEGRNALERRIDRDRNLKLDRQATVLNTLPESKGRAGKSAHSRAELNITPGLSELAWQQQRRPYLRRVK
jgi:hypothetical protein